METRSGMNVIKSKVRLNALLWREFTAAQMVEITGLKPESVRTELQRMKAEGLLEVSSAPRPADQTRKRGGQPVIYRLSSDPEKRLALSRSVEAFHPEVSQPQRPTSRHFALAVRLLDQASTEKDSHRREQLLVEADEELDFALAEEGGTRAPDTMRMHIELQRGRVAYLRGQDEQAKKWFGRVRQALCDAGVVVEATRANEYLLCIEARRRWATEGSYRPETRAQLLLDILGAAESQASNPLVQLLVDLLKELSQTPYEQVLRAVVKQLVAAGFATARMEERVPQYHRPSSLQIDVQETAIFAPSAPTTIHEWYSESREFYSQEHEVWIDPLRGFSVKPKR